MGIGELPYIMNLRQPLRYEWLAVSFLYFMAGCFSVATNHAVFVYRYLVNRLCFMFFVYGSGMGGFVRTVCKPFSVKYMG